MNRIIKFFAVSYTLLMIGFGSFFLSTLFHEWLHLQWDIKGNTSICVGLSPGGNMMYVTSSYHEMSFDERHLLIYFLQGITLVLFTLVGIRVLYSMMG